MKKSKKNLSPSKDTKILQDERGLTPLEQHVLKAHNTAASLSQGVSIITIAKMAIPELNQSSTGVDVYNSPQLEIYDSI